MTDEKADRTHGPIVADQHAQMNALARVIDEFFNGEEMEGRQKRVAFVLLTAKFADFDDGRVNYISNGQRGDIVAMMKELIGRFESDDGSTR